MWCNGRCLALVVCTYHQLHNVLAMHPYHPPPLSPSLPSLLSSLPPFLLSIPPLPPFVPPCLPSSLLTPSLPPPSQSDHFSALSAVSMLSSTILRATADSATQELRTGEPKIWLWQGGFGWGEVVTSSLIAWLFLLMYVVGKSMTDLNVEPLL